MMSHPATQLPPGFRFHPTDEELIVHYLMNRTATPSPCQASIIAEVDIYKFDPWDLPEKAMFGDREWYFFTPRDRKYPNGLRPNRAAVSGYWKATGSDKPISSGRQNVGVKKALVFYKGKPLKGAKTNWIMHEYRLPESQNSKSYRTMRLDDWVLCRIYKKSCHLSPLLIDQEQEDSCADNAYFHTQSLAQEHSILKFPKTSYISEIFEDYSQISNVFGNQQELTRFDRNTLIDQPISWLQQTNQSNDSTVLMRQKHEERNSSEQSGESLHSSEKQNDSNIFQSFSAQFDNSQYSLLINSQLDLQ